MKHRKKKLMRRKLSVFSLLPFLILLLLLPFIYIGFQSVTQLLSRAAGTKANILVDPQITVGTFNPSWKSFAQGGEETKDMIGPVVAEVKNLQPRYIRIDHLFDHHLSISRQGPGNLTLNFSRLDAIVKNILATGAKPFFALSYMPPAIAVGGDITGLPRDWNDWALVVQKTIEHYSGSQGMNLSGIYYEVWNEPDLFGKWKYSGEKNYLTLYKYAILGAQKAKNVQPFKVGGPATTQLYKNWMIAFGNYVTENNVRLDFLSWHRYNINPTQYKKDVGDITGWLFPYPQLVTIPRIISEWGFDSDIHPGYDGNLAAAHTVATIRQSMNEYEQLFAFELVDGPDPAGKKFWGRWGLITHPSTGKTLKPRYTAFAFLNKLASQRILLKGEGTWVSGLAAKNASAIQILLVNYDYQGRNSEQVPLTIKNLAPGAYRLTTTRIGQKPITTSVVVPENKYSAQVIMNANAVVFIELVPESETLGN